MSTRLIIAVDYDGTIANTHAEAVKWIKTHVGRDVEPWQCNRTDCVPLIGKSPYEEMNDYVYERESTLAAAEVPGAANALRALTVIGDVFVVTNRRLHRIAYAREWLERMGLALSIREVITSHDSSRSRCVTRSALMSLSTMMFDTSATYGWRDCSVSGCNTGEHRPMIARWVWRSAANGTRSWGCLVSLANNAVHRTGARVARSVGDR